MALSAQGPLPAGCIMIAATLRQTAAPVANVKSEIHMACFLVLFSVRRQSCLERAVNAETGHPFLELWLDLVYNSTNLAQAPPK